MLRTSYQAKRGRIGLLLISPWLIGFVLLKLVPIAASFVFALSDFNMLKPQDASFVGLANFSRLVRDEMMWTMLFSTVGLAVITVPFQLIIALLLAAMLSNEAIFGRNLYRTLIFLPSIIPGIAVFSVWFGFIDPASGWLNRLVMEPLNLPPYGGVNSESGRNVLLILLSIWNIGPAFLILSGAMLGVPKELYEAARVDGAGPLYRFLNITIPVISPAIFFSLLISLITVFGGTVLLDRSITFTFGSQSPMDAYIADVMFGKQALGYAASLAWVMFAIVLVIAIYLFRTAERWVYYPLEEA
ncbi:MAG: carbohydrate ABC transporter permease [Candidatus Promineifilaceae bacterium]